MSKAQSPSPSPLKADNDDGDGVMDGDANADMATMTPEERLCSAVNRALARRGAAARVDGDPELWFLGEGPHRPRAGRWWAWLKSGLLMLDCGGAIPIYFTIASLVLVLVLVLGLNPSGLVLLLVVVLLLGLALAPCCLVGPWRSWPRACQIVMWISASDDDDEPEADIHIRSDRDAMVKAIARALGPQFRWDPAMDRTGTALPPVGVVSGTHARDLGGGGRGALVWQGTTQQALTAARPHGTPHRSRRCIQRAIPWRFTLLCLCVCLLGTSQLWTHWQGFAHPQDGLWRVAQAAMADLYGGGGGGGGHRVRPNPL